MSFRSGKNSDAKKIMLRLPPEKGDDELYMLNRAQIKSLLTLSETIGWSTRHTQLPDYVNTQDKLQAFADETAQDLMMPIDFCEQIVACEDEILAILTNALSGDTASQLALQQAIKDMLLSDPDFITNIFNTYPSFPTGTLSETDSLDKLWAQCVQLVEYTHQAISDLLEIIEVQTNNVELVQYLNLIPGMKAFLTLVPIDTAFDLVNYLAATVGEQYSANYTETVPTGTKWKVACTLFCLCKDDKIINVSRMNDAIFSLLDDYVTPNWDNLQELVETVIGVNDNSEVMVFGLFFFMWGSAKLASTFGLYTVTAIAIKAVLALAENDANDDWEEFDLCTTCAVDLTCDGGTLIDFTVSENMFVPYYLRALYYSGEGWGRSLTVGTTRIQVQREMSPQPSKVRAWLSQSGFTMYLYDEDTGVGTTLVGAFSYIGEDDIGFLYECEAIDPMFNEMMVSVDAASPIPEEVRLIRLCIDYD